jgi:hypothetical protein
LLPFAACTTALVISVSCCRSLAEKLEAYSSLFSFSRRGETNPLIWTFIKGQENNDEELTLPECYIYLLPNYTSFVTKTIPKWYRVRVIG